MENISRRKFVATSLKAGAITAAMPLVANAENMSIFNPSALTFSQVKLPYDYSALEPHIDAMTMEIHYTKHHTAYIKTVNDLIAADKITAATEKEFFANASKLSAKARNNGGGAWNHNFFWEVMKPNGGGTPSGKIADAINGAFGSFQAFKDQFSTAAKDRFGSGWAWLVNDNGKLKIGSTANQDNPLMDSSELKGTPLLGIDVWEHAYYLKYQNKRPDYIAAWFNVINWDAVASRLS